MAKHRMIPPLSLTISTARRLCTAAPASEAAAGEPETRKALFRRLAALRGDPNGSVWETMEGWVKEGKAVTSPKLIKVVRELCKFKHHTHALEVMDWIEKKGLLTSNGSQALYLNLLSKIRGIESAENYFSTLTDLSKDQRTYRELLFCYCRRRMKDKAISLFEKMKQHNIALDVFVYNNLMSLHMKLNERTNVIDLFEEMKVNNISPDNCCYRILIENYAYLNKMDSVEKAIQEMEGSGLPLDCFTYCRLAEIYSSAALFEKAEIALKKAELVMGKSDFSVFPLLIRLYSMCGNLTEVKKVWKLLERKTKRPNNQQYLEMLLALKKLDDMEGLKQCFEEWKCGCVNYDTRVVNVVIEAYLEKGMVKDAELIQLLSAERRGESGMHERFENV